MHRERRHDNGGRRRELVSLPLQQRFDTARMHQQQLHKIGMAVGFDFPGIERGAGNDGFDMDERSGRRLGSLSIKGIAGNGCLGDVLKVPPFDGILSSLFP
jgi:hypothetical protein